jgi:hypothetical protein
MGGGEGVRNGVYFSTIGIVSSREAERSEATGNNVNCVRK